MIRNGFIKITLKDKSVVSGTYTGETEETVNIIQEMFTFETYVLKSQIKKRETIVPYIEPTETEQLQMDESRLVEKLIDNRNRQLKIKK